MDRRIEGLRGARRVPHGLKSGEPAALSLKGVDREGFKVAAAGMRRMIAAAADRAAVPGIDDVECQRHVRLDGRMQACGWQPGASADPEFRRP